MTTEPLVFEFRVACDQDHAFRTWTEKFDAWWPKDHSAAGTMDTVVIFEGRSGGRIFERTPAGEVIEWGRVTGWDPPHRVSYSWHIGVDATEATDVELAFEPDGEHTVVRLVHVGWERFAVDGTERREANERGWSDVLAAFVAFV